MTGKYNRNHDLIDDFISKTIIVDYCENVSFSEFQSST